MKSTVLVTGASGALGSILLAGLPRRGWNVVGLDRTSASEATLLGDVTDIDSILDAMSGVDAVVHLAGVSVPGADWDDYLRINVDGTFNVLESARRLDVRKIILASSNHAVGYTPRGNDPLPDDIPPRPDSLYGVSKAAGESLGLFFADEYGLSIASVRIGSCFERPLTSRMLATWLSPADFVRLTDSLLRSAWDGHKFVWGVSNNSRRWFSIDRGRELGYWSRDDGEAFGAGIVGDIDNYVGGSPPKREI